MLHEAHAIWTRTTEASAHQFDLVTFQAAYAQEFGDDKCVMYVAETGPDVLRIIYLIVGKSVPLL